MKKVPTSREALENLVMCLDDLEQGIQLFREYAWFYEMQNMFLTGQLDQIRNQIYQPRDILKRMLRILLEEDLKNKKLDK